MAKRLLSSSRPWWRDGGVLCLIGYFALSFPWEGGQRGNGSYFVFVGMVLFIGVPILWGQVRARPFLWEEVTEDEGVWIFRRKGEVLRVRPEEVRQVFPFGYGGRGLLILRLRAEGAGGKPRLLMFPGGTVSEEGRRLPVLDYLTREVARARTAEFIAPTRPAKPERISSLGTFWLKHVVPWVGFGALGLWTAWSWSAMAQAGQWSGWAVAVPVLLGLFGFVLHHEFLSNLVDEVWDMGDALRVRSRGREHLLPLSEVERLDYRPMQGLHWIVVHLHTSHPLGKKWVFIPQGRGSIEGWSPQLDALEERLDQG